MKPYVRSVFFQALRLLLLGALSGCEGSGVSTSIGVGGGGGPGIGIVGGSYGAYGGYGGTGVGITFPSSSSGASVPAPITDQQVIDVTVQHALEFRPIGESVPWGNPDTGHSGSITTTRAYQGADGRTCKEFQQTLGQSPPTTATACRDGAGIWQVTIG